MSDPSTEKHDDGTLPEAALPEEALTNEGGAPAEEEGEALPGGTASELLYEAEANRRRALAAMSLVHKEHYSFLFANCFFLAGSLAAWTRAPFAEPVNGGTLMHGLDTIRGAAIFALAIFGFIVSIQGLYTKRTVVWPFLLNAMLGLWVGLGGVVKGLGGPAWDLAYKNLKDPTKFASYSKLDEALAGVSTIAPGFWMLTGASLLVLFVVVKGIVSGASKAKAAASEAGEAGEGRRRRR